MAASQAAHEGSIPFTRFYFDSAKQKRRAVVPRLRDEGGRRSAPDTDATTSFAAEEFLEGLEEFVRDVASFFSEVIELLRELHLFAAVYFARRGRNLVRWKINFIGSAGGFATSGREMI